MYRVIDYLPFVGIRHTQDKPIKEQRRTYDGDEDKYFPEIRPIEGITVAHEKDKKGP